MNLETIKIIENLAKPTWEQETPKDTAQRMREESHREEEHQKCEECNVAGTHKHFFNDEYIYLCDYHFSKVNK